MAIQTLCQIQGWKFTIRREEEYALEKENYKFSEATKWKKKKAHGF